MSASQDRRDKKKEDVRKECPLCGANTWVVAGSRYLEKHRNWTTGLLCFGPDDHSDIPEIGQ